MQTLQQIEEAIQRLPTKDRWALLNRFQSELWEEWDQQIGEDLSAGRLDHLIAEAEADIAMGRTRPLDEILND
jgi:hypothetical protein